ncbi:hypothetical protein [Antarcticirhabdus aurantiaca]|uniref:Uncharacterized protein n=1 Tax=Antarcticirhabdus aurantiaca TaxID=2606717 RepID=A0ACD4NNA8_9HYPH|nr:hypothetical protein [Antarcticirhabdus aurantiaca]WAJ28344.1 hypothetical protein OXU80_26630 [Jeongeuplla avenae]
MTAFQLLSVRHCERTAEGAAGGLILLAALLVGLLAAAMPLHLACGLFCVHERIGAPMASDICRSASQKVSP